MNPWNENTEELFSTILECVKGKWFWHKSRGMRCKYITIRIDMRDGGYIMHNDEGQRIDVDELKYQGAE